jgi:hypothetical protein
MWFLIIPALLRQLATALELRMAGVILTLIEIQPKQFIP